MQRNNDTAPIPKRSGGWFQGGRMGYSTRTERRIWFALTLLMMAAGVLYKTGVW